MSSTNPNNTWDPANNGSTRITIFIESGDPWCGAGLVEESGDTPKRGEGGTETSRKGGGYLTDPRHARKRRIKRSLIEASPEGITMRKKYSWGIALIASALAVGWLLGTAGVATAWEAESPFFNLTKVSEDGNQLEDFTFAKLDARGHLDGHILYTGCYLPDRCFRVVDVKDHKYPTLLASPPTFNMERAPAPP